MLKFQKALKFLTIALSLAVLGTLAVGAPVAAVNETAIITPTSGPPGTVITVSGTGWAANSVIGIQAVPHWGGTAYSVTSGPTGAFSSTITVPLTAESGTYILYFTQNTSTVSLQFTVVTGQTFYFLQLTFVAIRRYS